MKNLYDKNKGKVYPSPSSPSSPTSKPNPDTALSVLKFLPATILALASILTLEDREVLAYLLTTNPSSISTVEVKNQKKCKKPHKSPVFDCGCFECYTSYWFRWDSSPNRELIHQVIEAFEEHGERGKKNRGKKREKLFDKSPAKTPYKIKNEEKALEMVVPVVLELEEEEVVVEEKQSVVVPENDGILDAVPDESEKEEGEAEMVVGDVAETAEEMLQVLGSSNANSNHRGLARKVLPDVMGLFNSRIWSLWSTNI